MGIIYKHYFNHNPNKLYIGKTKYSMEERLKQHLISESHFGYAIRKYGIYNLVSEIIEDNIIEKELNIREKYWIKFYNSFLGEGYNHTEGGDGGNTRENMTNSEEHRMNISKAQIGKPKKEGNKCGQYKKSKEHKKKLSESVSNEFWMSNEKETIKIKKNEEQLYIDKGYIRGRKHYISGNRKGCKGPSEEQKKKISETLRNKPNIACTYCDKEGPDYVMNRWHMEKCKYK